MATRHRGIFRESLRDVPWEISRSKVEDFMKCRTCFWREKIGGVKRVGMPGFLINTNTDRLLKKEFDKYRGKKSHPFLIHQGLGYLIPYDFPEKWTLSTAFGAEGYFHYDHEPSNIRLGGGIDDIYENTETGELHVVDYKSTSQGTPKEITLDGYYKQAYKRQADMYAWILEKLGYEVGKTAYFLFVDGLHEGIDGMIDEDPEYATMKFKTSLIEHETDTSWIDKTLLEIKGMTYSNYPPPLNEDCDDCIYLGNFQRMDTFVRNSKEKERMADATSSKPSPFIKRT